MTERAANLERWAQVDKEKTRLHENDRLLQDTMNALAVKYNVPHELYQQAYRERNTQQVERWPDLKQMCLRVYDNHAREMQLNSQWLALRPALDLDSLLKTFFAPSSSEQLQESLVRWINFELYQLEDEIQKNLQSAIDAYKRDRRGYTEQLDANSFNQSVWRRTRGLHSKLERYTQMTHQELKWKRLRDNLWYMKWMHDDYRLLHQKMEALAMGLHPRLGEASQVQGLSDETIRMIHNMWTMRVPRAPR